MIYVFLIILTLAVALLYLRYRLHRTPDNEGVEKPESDHPIQIGQSFF
ncbi:hypothetical protein [Thiothrix lacustris]|nr:hypothetical protein [Thiothrix lacustris]